MQVCITSGWPRRIDGLREGTRSSRSVAQHRVRASGHRDRERDEGMDYYKSDSMGSSDALR